MNTVLGLLAIFFFAYSIVMTMLWIRADQDADSNRREAEMWCDIIADEKSKASAHQQVVLQQRQEISRNLDKISKYELHIDALTAQTRDQIAKIAELNRDLAASLDAFVELHEETSRLKAEDDRKTALLAKFNQK